MTPTTLVADPFAWSPQLAAALECHATLQYYPDSAHRFHKWWEASYWPCKQRCMDERGCAKTYYEKQMWTCKAAALQTHDDLVNLPTEPPGAPFNFTTPWLVRQFYGPATPPRRPTNTCQNYSGRRARSQVAGAPLERRGTPLLGPGRGGHARHFTRRSAVPRRAGPEALRDFGLVRHDGRPLAHVWCSRPRPGRDHGAQAHVHLCFWMAVLFYLIFFERTWSRLRGLPLRHGTEAVSYTHLTLPTNREV